ncbi:MAG: glycosyltransferase, exosortase system-associated [Candidatus Angelobacter sp.]|jgi:glycosyltransferase involved in cell wall biosynthesis|nr:glycosyltransferase, exosortase system-associated [Candidatus Angelobacter sp.]
MPVATVKILTQTTSGDRKPDAFPETGRVRPWAVVHACDHAREVANVVEAQIHVGMRPYLIMLNGSRALTSDAIGQRNTRNNPVSLLKGWQDVRCWRKQFDENGTSFHAQLIHAHSFAAGMAAIRGGDAVVYDVREWIEEQTNGTNSWLARSFRTAEQFALARSSAIVVHSHAMRSECVSRGIAPEDVFVVPDPVCGNTTTMHDVPPQLEALGLEMCAARGKVLVLAKVTEQKSETLGRNHANNSFDLNSLFLTLSQAVQENDAIRLLLVSPGNLLLSISKKARELDIRDKVIITAEEDQQRAMAAAEIVIADPVSISDAQGADESIALAAMVQGKAVLALDNAANRDLSPDGRGLLWFSPDPKSMVRDLAHRLAFLARNADFRSALGKGGQHYIFDARSPARIGHMYDDVYRHAYARRGRGESSRGTSGALIPVEFCT